MIAFTSILSLIGTVFHFMSKKQMSQIYKNDLTKGPVLLTLVTSVRDPDCAQLLETAASLDAQTIPHRAFQWYIVDDHSSDKKKASACYEKIESGYYSLGVRLFFIPNSEPRYLPAARNFGTRMVSTPYVGYLDGDDKLQPPALETALFFLETQPNFSIAQAYIQEFGDRNAPWYHGFHDGTQNFERNGLSSFAVVRMSHLKRSACQFDQSMITGKEDWDFWLCMGEKGFWGLTMPVKHFLYRTRSARDTSARWKSNGGDMSKKTDAYVHKKYPLFKKQFKYPTFQQTTTKDTDEALKSWMAYRKGVPPTQCSVLIFAPWIKMGGADLLTILLAKYLKLLENCHVSVLMHLMDENQRSFMWLEELYAVATDVFMLPTFTVPKLYGRFIEYLVTSRRITQVVINNSQLGFDLAKWMRTALGIRVYAYLHSRFEEPRNRKNDYVSQASSRPLDAVFVGYKALDPLITHKRVYYTPMGIDVSKMPHTTRSLRTPSKHHVVYIGRYSKYKQVDVIVNLAQKPSMKDVKFTLIGGPSATEGESDRIVHAGAMSHDAVLDTLKQGGFTVFMLPSTSEGVSVSMLEAMSCGVVPIVTNVGGASEAVKHGYNGLLVPFDEATTTKAQLVNQFETAMVQLMSSHKTWLEYSARARRTVKTKFNIRTNIRNLVKLLITERKQHQHQKLNRDSVPFSLPWPMYNSYMTHLALLESKRRVVVRNTRAGQQLQTACAEHAPEHSRWIDVVEAAQLCPGFSDDDADPNADPNGAAEFIPDLLKNALVQCYQWCIFDVRPGAHKLSGWMYRLPGCFVPFMEFSDCAFNYEALYNTAKEKMRRAS